MPKDRFINLIKRNNLIIIILNLILWTRKKHDIFIFMLFLELIIYVHKIWIFLLFVIGETVWGDWISIQLNKALKQIGLYLYFILIFFKIHFYNKSISRSKPAQPLKSTRTAISKFHDQKKLLSIHGLITTRNYYQLLRKTYVLRFRGYKF